MFTHTRGKHRRPSRRGRNLVALLSIAAFGLSTFVASQPATAANPSDPTFSTGIAFDGTGQGTASACPIIGAGGDNTANDAVVCHATYYFTQADVDHGSVSDTAVATGRTPKPTQVTSPPVTLKVTFVLKTPTTTPGLAHTGVPVLEIVGGGLLLLLGGLFLVVIGTRRRKA